MNGLISNALAKVARFAVSKAAAFSYAVAVGVAGNLVFHFVQTQAPIPIPAVLTAPPDASQTGQKQPGAPTATAVIAPKPAVAPLPEPPTAAPASTAVVSAPAAPPTPMPKPALPLPERPTASLPDAASPPAPIWKPLQLPSAPVSSAPASSEAAVRPTPAPGSPAQSPTAPSIASQLTAPQQPSPEPARELSGSVASLPPLGPPIEVSTPPTPPDRVAAQPPKSVTALPPTAPAPPPKADGSPQHSLELSDIWHPYRAVKKGINWAGDQLPAIGGDGAEARPAPPTAIPASASAVPMITKRAPAAEPIPLLPAKEKPELADAPASQAKPVAPGPGSGGLY